MSFSITISIQAQITMKVSNDFATLQVVDYFLKQDYYKLLSRIQLMPPNLYSFQTFVAPFQ
jgi:hypothetical protein